MPRTIPNQKQFAASQEEIDAGKFLRSINSGAQAQVSLFEDRVRRMGQEVGANWRLVSLCQNKLIFEDVDTNKYYGADIKNVKAGRVSIKNIREYRITDSKKQKQFNKQLNKLIESISEGDTKSANDAFDSITERRFRGNVIPESGYVTTRDGIARYVRISDSILSDKAKRPIIKAVTKALSEGIKIQRGRIVEATFNNRSFRIPITEMTRRCVVARSIKKMAQHAYLAEGFQQRVAHCASLISNKTHNSIKEAVKIAADLLKEEQEFSLLTLKEMKQLVSDTLATEGIMNQKLAEDIGLMFYKTNCHINRLVILDEWKHTARMTEYAPLVENVRRLSDSDKFEKDYNIFLEAFFKEDMTTKAAKAKMYLAALRDMRNVLENSEEQQLLDSLDEYITRLEEAGEDVDDATLMEIEELVASTSENLLNDVSNLADYDEIPAPPGAEPGPTFGDEDLGAEQGDVDVDVDAGLPFGGGGFGGEEDLGGEGEEGGPEGEGEEGELPPEGEEEEEEDLEDLLAASKNRKGKVVAEAKACVKCGKMECPCGCEGDASKCTCPSAMEGKDKNGKCKHCGDYGVLSEYGMCAECGGAMEQASRKFTAKLSKLNESQLRKEYAAWRKNASKYFTEEGHNKCSLQLRLYSEHAHKIGADDLAAKFRKIVVDNTPEDLMEDEQISDEVGQEQLYEYQAPKDINIDMDYGMSEDHDTWKGKMKQSKEGGQEGGKETAHSKGDAMGNQEEEDDIHTMKDAPPGKLKGDDTRKVGLAREDCVKCGDCSGEFDLSECVTNEGVVCPECGAPMYEQVESALNEELSGEGHQMDRMGGDSGGVSATSLGKSDGRSGSEAGSGSKDTMDHQGGSSVVDDGLTDSDGRTAVRGAGSKEKMEQPGKGIQTKGKGQGHIDKLTEGEDKDHCPKCDCPRSECGCPAPDDVEEDQFKDPTRRRRYAYPNSGRDSINATESKKLEEDQTVVMITDQPVDDVVSQIAASMTTELGGDPVEEPLEEPVEEPLEEPAEEPLEEPVEEPLEEPLEEPAEEPLEEPAEEPLEEPGEEFPLEDEEEEDDLDEGKLPPALEKHKIKKGTDADQDGEKGEGSKKPWEKENKDSSVSEDNDITTPQSKGYDSEKAARNDGDGNQMRAAPKLKQTDEAGRKNIGPARSNSK